MSSSIDLPLSAATTTAAAAAAVATAAAGNSSSSTLGSLAMVIPNWTYKAVRSSLLFAPSLALRLLATNFEITLSLSTLLLILAVLVTLCILIVRYKFLTGYSKDIKNGVQGKSKLSDPKKPTGSIDLVSSVKKKRDTSSSSNYLDEFLSAIKVFGYLEKPVFHELTKNMTTQRVSADEILHVDEKLGFSIVVEGTIQVFIKIKTQQQPSPSKKKEGSTAGLDSVLEENGYAFDEEEGEDTRSSEDDGGEEEEDADEYDDEDYKGETLKIGTQKYQLLNEVKSGAPLSSLMSALELFKNENIFHDGSTPSKFSTNALNSPIMSPRFTVSDNPSPASEEELAPLDPNYLGENASDGPTPYHPRPPSINTQGFSHHPNNQASLKDSIVYPEIIARPKADKDHKSSTGSFSSATIAIIPRSAFERVQTKYPRASSHIVTMVLTRLNKVTISTIHNYLGLTREIVESEIKLNKLNEGDENHLPSYLRNGVVDKFKRKRLEDRQKKQKKDSSSNADETDSSSSLSSLPKTAKASASSRRIAPLARTSSSRYVVLDSRTKSTHPGDLLSSVPLSRRSDYYQTHTTIPHEEKGNGNSASGVTVSALATPYTSTSTTSKALPSSTAIRDFSFTSDREETEETSLRIAIVENLFKILGINESEIELSFQSSGGRFSFSNPSLELPSKSASAVGLSSLMNGNGHHHNHHPGTYGGLSTIGRSRLDSAGGIQKNHSYKYDTINKSDFITIEEKLRKAARNQSISEDERAKPKRKRNSYSRIDFDSVKHEFSKYLDLKYYSPNSVLVEQGKFDSGLYYVIDGSLDAFNEKNKRIYSIKEGGLAGYLSSIVGFRSLVTIKAPKDRGVIVAHISRKDFTVLSDKFYFLQLPVASKLKSLLSKKILTIDYALEWCHIPAGNVLSEQGDMANGFHIVLSGRFRVVRTTKKKKDAGQSNVRNQSNTVSDADSTLETVVLGEYSHGESIGEVEVLTASRRTSSLIAVRDSETARIPRTLFEMLSIQDPSVMIEVSRIVANKVTKQSQGYQQLNGHVINSTIPTSTSAYQSTDYKTITILPTTSGLPVREFADKLVYSLKSIGRKVISLDQASTLTHLGRHAFDERLSRLKLSGYFAYLEEEYETIVYICDSSLRSTWTSTCISQGDCILLLADAEDNEIAQGVGDYEKLLLKQKTTARTDLCLIHPDKFVEPGSTSVWLKNRIWVQGHHHIQMEITRENTEETSTKASNIIQELAAKVTNPNLKLKLIQSKTLNSIVENFNPRNRRRLRRRGLLSADNSLSPTVATHKNDFLRLARILSNEAVGLVLGGGGSRGISHIGVVAALEKHGIPVDLIGGTSIGSFVGGLYAKDYNSVAIYGRAKVFSMRVSSLWRSILDLTYPVTSYITGYEFNRGIWKTFGFSEIEDFWLRYFCNSTNITNSTMDIHETGYSWRFIRASMSLAGLLPPITYDGCMLLDGGYLDNLPVMEMKKKGAKYIIAVDVGSVDDRTPMNYGDTLSGFWVLFNRWNPFSQHPNVPNMMDIQLRLAYVASVNALEIAKNTPGVVYLRPPIDNYATLDFAKFDEIYHVGLDYADRLFMDLESSGKFPAIAGRVDKSKKEQDPHKFLFRRNSI